MDKRKENQLKNTEKKLRILVQELWDVKENFISVGIDECISPYNIAIDPEVQIRKKEPHEYPEYLEGVLVDVCGDDDQIVLIYGTGPEDWTIVSESEDWVY